MNASKKLVLALAIAGAIGMISAPSYGDTNGGGSSGGGSSGGGSSGSVDFNGTHYLCYEVKRAKDNTGRYSNRKWKKVLVTNQFDSKNGIYLEVGNPTQLCLPSKKVDKGTCNRTWNQTNRHNGLNTGNNCDDD